MSIVAVALLAAVGWAASGCGGDEPDGTIAFLLPDEGAVRYEAHDRPDFERKVAELCSQCTVLYRNARGDKSLQQEQAEKALAQGAKVLVVDPVDPNGAARILHVAKPRGVPVVSYDRLILNSRVDYYVDVDPEASGALQAKELTVKLGEEGHPRGPVMLVETGYGGSMNLGMEKEFNARGIGAVDVYHMPEIGDEASSAVAEREMRQAIAAHGRNSFEGVYATDDNTAGGVIKAMRTAGINPEDRLTTGFGAKIPALRRILTGQQYMTVYGANKQEAAVAAEVAVELADGKEIPPSRITAEPANGLRDVPAILLKPTAVTKENIKSAVIDNGFVDPAELCAGRYAEYCAKAGIPTG